MQEYDYTGKLSEGFRRVKRGTFKQSYCGFIDNLGNEVIPLIYANVRDFREGMAAVRTGNWASGKWGFINTSGELVVPVLFEHPRPFRHGFSKVILNGDWCFINKQGNKVISLKEYDGGSNFCNGYAIVRKSIGPKYEDRRYGVIDQTGAEVIPCIDIYGFDYMTLATTVHRFSGKSQQEDLYNKTSGKKL